MPRQQNELPAAGRWPTLAEAEVCGAPIPLPKFASKTPRGEGPGSGRPSITTTEAPGSSRPSLVGFSPKSEGPGSGRPSLVSEVLGSVRPCLAAATPRSEGTSSGRPSLSCGTPTVGGACSASNADRDFDQQHHQEFDEPQEVRQISDANLEGSLVDQSRHLRGGVCVRQVPTPARTDVAPAKQQEVRQHEGALPKPVAASAASQWSPSSELQVENAGQPESLEVPTELAQQGELVCQSSWHQVQQQGGRVLPQCALGSSEELTAARPEPALQESAVPQAAPAQHFEAAVSRAAAALASHGAGKQPWERVAQLEGALEMERERVRQLEASARSTSQGPQAWERVAALEGKLGASRDRVKELQEQLRTANGELDGSRKKPETRVAEEPQVLQAYEQRLASLEQQAREREERLAEEVLLVQKKQEQDLRELAARLQQRERSASAVLQRPVDKNALDPHEAETELPWAWQEGSTSGTSIKPPKAQTGIRTPSLPLTRSSCPAGALAPDVSTSRASERANSTSWKSPQRPRGTLPRARTPPVPQPRHSCPAGAMDGIVPHILGAKAQRASVAERTKSPSARAQTPQRTSFSPCKRAAASPRRAAGTHSPAPQRPLPSAQFSPSARWRDVSGPQKFGETGTTEAGTWQTTYRSHF